MRPGEEKKEGKGKGRKGVRVPIRGQGRRGDKKRGKGGVEKIGTREYGRGIKLGQDKRKGKGEGMDEKGLAYFLFILFTRGGY